MGTRSRIGIQLKDDSILSIYSHWDGYPEFNGVKLIEHFNSYDKASELIDGGDISALWTNVGWNNETLDNLGPLYYSTRGEDLAPRLDSDLCEYLSPDGSEEYHYLFTNGQWVCYNMHQFDDTKLPEPIDIPTPVSAGN